MVEFFVCLFLVACGAYGGWRFYDWTRRDDNEE